MKKNSNFFGGGIFYLAPTVEVTTLAVERGFEVSLPGLETEEGEGWE